MIKKVMSVFCIAAIMLGMLSLYSCDNSSNTSDGNTTNEESGFNTSEWVGDVELPESSSTAVPDNYVVPERLEGETDDSAAIDRALDSIKETGGTVYFCKSNYTISKPITIYKNISYVGRGVGQTTITVKEGANCDAFVTYLFDSYCDQKNYNKVVSAYFGPNSDLPQNFEIRGLTIDGNAGFICTNTIDNTYSATKNTKGSGIKIFGKRYIIENVQIQNFAQIGYYTEFNAPEVTGVDTSFDYFICTKIDGLRIISTGEEGLIYRGPSDQEIDGLWVCSSCLTGKSTVYADRTGWELAAVVFEDKESSNGNTSYCASPELGFAHIWRGFNCWGMVLVGQLRFKADHLIIESTNGGLKTSKLCYSQISILDIHNCMYGDNSRPYMLIDSTTHTKISNLEMRYGYDKSQKDMIWINGNNVTIGECLLRANYDIVGKSNAGGHGVVINGNFNQISALNAMYFAGNGNDG
ncbi:MAG: glycosyl hydrolase family 28-related protein, partial [Eubacteriales bacterium]